MTTKLVCIEISYHSSKKRNRLSWFINEHRAKVCKIWSTYVVFYQLWNSITSPSKLKFPSVWSARVMDVTSGVSDKLRDDAELGTDCREELALGAPGCRSGLPIRTRESILSRPSWISFLSSGIVWASWSSDDVSEGLEFQITSLNELDKFQVLKSSLNSVSSSSSSAIFFQDQSRVWTAASQQH